ncbi:MAG: formylglycine-generating enzyme family protein [Candidatus Electrothrix sp. YB6]
MNRLRTQVSRADILRLLAVQRTASVDAAARLSGYIAEKISEKQHRPAGSPEPIKNQVLPQRRPTETAVEEEPVETEEVTDFLPPERFWSVHKRQQVQQSVYGSVYSIPAWQKEVPGDGVALPVALQKIVPLQPEELRLPEFIPCSRSQSAGREPCSFSGSFSALPDRIGKQALSGAGINRLVVALAKFSPLHRLSHRSRGQSAVRQSAATSSAAQPEKKFRLHIRRLLGLLAVTTYADSRLFSGILRLLPSSFPDLEIEAAVRLHPDVQWNERMQFAVRPEKLAAYQQVFAEEAPAVQAGMVDLLRQHRSVDAPALFALELLHLCPLFRSAEMMKRYAGQLLEGFMLRVVRTWFARPEDSSLLRYARRLFRLLEMLPETVWKQRPGPSFLYGIVHRERLRAGAVVPPQYDPEAVLCPVRQVIVPSAGYLLQQQGECIFLSRMSPAGTDRGPVSPLAELVLSADCLLLYREEQVEILPVRSGRPIFNCSGRTAGFCLQTPLEKISVRTCFRPFWARSIGRNSRGLFVDVSWLGRTERLLWKNQSGNRGNRTGCWVGTGSTGGIGTDQYGLYADVALGDRAMQRFRRIEPGRFMMGSPADETERESLGRESLHEVVLTKGFWMADTAVTQKMWQAMMGENPACFQGDSLPVENVSRHDALRFVRRLNRLIPGIVARLPTEAEWEYCCRAGTSTPFFFGEQISPQQVNYKNKQHPRQDTSRPGTSGNNSRGTVAVQSLPCNAWGLYEMHGNVWEWCQDYWQDDLAADEPVIDPQGPAMGEFCVVRGGSWFLGSRGVRSAVRGKFAPHFSNNRIGFRLVLNLEQGEERVP